MTVRGYGHVSYDDEEIDVYTCENMQLETLEMWASSHLFSNMLIFPWVPKSLNYSYPGREYECKAS